MEDQKTEESLPPSLSGKEKEKVEELSEDIYDTVEYLNEKAPMDEEGYLLPHPEQQIRSQDELRSRLSNNNNASRPSNGISVTVQHPKVYEKANGSSNRSGVRSIYQDLWSFSRNGAPKTVQDDEKEMNNQYHPLIVPNQVEDEPIYDNVDSVIAANICSAKVIPIEEPPSAYNEVIINEGRYVIPAARWASESDAWDSDFDDEEVPSYFGNNLERLYENVETRRVVSPTRTSVCFKTHQDDTKPREVQQQIGCWPLHKSSKNDLEESAYVEPNNTLPSQPIMPAASQDLSVEEVVRHKIVSKIVASEALYMVYLKQLVQMEQGARERSLLETEKLDVIFCSLQDILRCHEMFNMVLVERMNEWTVNDKLGDIICASFSKSTSMVAYVDFVTNFPTAIDTYRMACKSNTVFAHFLEAKEKTSQLNMGFHDIMLKPFERFPEFILLIQDFLEVTPIDHLDRVPLQLSLTQLECLAENINLRCREMDLKNHVMFLDSHISQLNKPLSAPGRFFIRQDDMIHCLVDGVSIVETKKLRLVLLSDMLLCLSPISKKKNIMSGLLNTPKYKYKLKWNVPLLDVQFVEYGAGVNVAAGKYGTTTTYSDKGKYRQATAAVQKHIEDLQHDLAVIGQIAGLASSLRGEHQLIDQQKVEKWYKSVENTINEEIKAVNMFWLEISLPTRSGQQNYVFKLSSPTVKEEWEYATRWAKLALETRNNPGWYLPDDDIDNGMSILRRNMPLLAEFFDLFIFNTKSRVEHTLTYPVEASSATTTMATKGLGHCIWISARGDHQGHVTVLQVDHNSSLPRFVESFKACTVTVYSMERIPAMNSRPDQRQDNYHTKYGFPFPTVWLGSHSSRIYIYDDRNDDRTKPLMELRLRDAPLVMRYANKKIYVGLANGTLAIFRSNASEHWNLAQPSILPLGRFPVAVIANVKNHVWCGSGSQIYVVSKKGNRIKRIMAVDSNMKSLVKQIVSCGVGVWVSVWRKASIKLYHAETCEMLQEINIVSPVMKMRNDVDSQVQYLALDKISVTALVVIPGFLWVGTNCGLILIYPLPKLQGVPRVVGRACVAFHAHCGPVRSLLALPDGVLSPDDHDNLISDVVGENTKEIERRVGSVVAESDESVDSDEDFSFVDEERRERKGSPSDKKSGFGVGKFKVSLLKPMRRSLRSKRTPRPEPVFDIPDVEQIKVDDFATMMGTFDGFPAKGVENVEGETNVENKSKSFNNRLYAATYPKESERNRLSGSHLAAASSPDINVPSGKDTPPAKDALPGKDTLPGKYTLSGEDTLSGKDTPSEEKQPLSENCTPKENRDMEKPAEGHSVLPEKGTVKTQSVEGGTLASDESPSVMHDDSPVAQSSDAQNNETELVDGQCPPGLAVQLPSGDKSQEIGVEPIYVNVPRLIRSNAGDDSPDDVPLENLIGKTAPLRDDKAEGGIPNTDGTSTPGANPQELYTVVLPDKKEPSAVDVNPTASEEPPKVSAKSSQRGLSYLVMSAGEGHVDLRMKLKSKSDIKKDLQTMLLIWRANGKA